MSSNEDYNSSSNVSMYKTLSSRAMVIAIIVLFSVVFFMLFLHIIAKWYWRYARRHISGRSRFVVVGSADNRQQFGNSGLDQSVIDSLPTFNYHAQSSSPSSADKNDDAKSFTSSTCDCAVCLSEFREAEKGRTLPRCNHSFHVDCIDMWLHSHSTCPLCRADVLSSESSKEQPNCAQDTSPLPILPSPMSVSMSMLQVPTTVSSIPSSPMQSMSISMSSVPVSVSASASASPLPNSEPNGQQISSNEMQFDHVISVAVTPCANNGNGNDNSNDSENNSILFFNEDTQSISEVNSPQIPETSSPATQSPIPAIRSPTPEISIDIPARQHPWQIFRCLSMPRSCQAMDMELSSNSQPAKLSWIFRQSFKLGRQRSKGRSIRVFPSNVQNSIVSDHRGLEAQEAYASPV